MHGRTRQTSCGEHFSCSTPSMTANWTAKSLGSYSANWGTLLRRCVLQQISLLASTWVLNSPCEWSEQSDIEEMLWEVDEDCDQAVTWAEFQAMYHRCRTDQTGAESYQGCYAWLQQTAVIGFGQFMA